MGYASKIKPADLKRLQPLIQAVESLPEGEEIVYSGHPLEISRDRTIMYTYFAINEQQGLFRIQTSPEELVISRPRTFTPAADLACQLARRVTPVSKRKPAVRAQAQQSVKVAYTPGIAFFDQHAHKAENIDEFHKEVESSDLPESERVIAMEEWHRAHQAATQPQKHWTEMTKEEKGEAQLPREQVPEGSGIEFYNQHADTTWPEIYKLVSTAEAAGELSDPEANQALTEWQDNNPEFKPSSGKAAKEEDNHEKQRGN